MSAYQGLSPEEFADIHESVMEAMAYVSLPVVFWRLVAAQTVDPLYGETQGPTQWEPYAPLRASVREQPTDEVLTHYGLEVNKDLLLFIPRGYIAAWEALHGVPFAPREDEQVEYRGVRYNIDQVRTDELPVGDGTTADSIGTVVTASIKPRGL